MQKSGSVVLWYDAVTTEGRLVWQNELNDSNAPYFLNADGAFLNYTWTPQHLHRSRAVATARTTDAARVAADIHIHRPSPDAAAAAGGGGGGGNAGEAEMDEAQRRARVAAEMKRRRGMGPLDVFAGIDVFGRNTFGGGKMTCYKAVDAIRGEPRSRARQRVSVSVL